MRMQMNIHMENQELIMRLLREARKRPKPIIKKAVNETAAKAKEKMYKGVKQDYTIKSSSFSKRDLNVKKATVSRLYAQIEASGAPLSLPKAYKTVKNRKRTAAKAAVKRGALKPLQKGGLKGFMSQMKSEHRGIFQRTSKAKYPIKELMGPSVPKLSETVYRTMEGELQAGLREALWKFIDEAF